MASLTFIGCLFSSQHLTAAHVNAKSYSRPAIMLAAGQTAVDMTQLEDVDMAAIKSNEGNWHQVLKQKFIEGNPTFMSLVALTLILGLIFCIERIIYLTLSEIDTKRFMAELEKRILNNDIEGAKAWCREKRGPIASMCYQGILRMHEQPDVIERSIAAYGNLQSGLLEKGCSWITLFITMAPSLGFLGTVIGMAMSFEDISLAGDLSPTVVASGMKVALLTTIFGIIVALILQVFYNYILTKIDRLISQMEDSAIIMMDILTHYKKKY